MSDWHAQAPVPREPFVPPVVWQHDPSLGGFTAVSRRESNDEWQSLVDADEPIVTQVDDGRTPPGQTGLHPTSSCSQPSLVLAMQNALDVHSGHRVLEIGTGSGWNAALLAARTSPHGRVTTVEIDPAVAQQARTALRRTGFAPDSPHVVHTDGTRGFPPAQPYDRVIATASVTTLPRTWLDQTRPGGILVAPWGTDYCNGALLRMIVHQDGSARGTFGPELAFMRLRNQRRHHVTPSSTEMRSTVRSTTTRTPNEIDEIISFDRAAFTIGLLVPDCYLTVEAPDERHHILELHDARTRSWARVAVDRDAATTTASQLGPRHLWSEVDAAYTWWLANGRPSPANHELLIAPDGTHALNVRTPGGGWRWTLARTSPQPRGGPRSTPGNPWSK